VVAPGVEVIWEEFVASLHKVFGDSDHVALECFKIKEVKQGKGTANDFVMQFEEYDSFTDFDKMALFNLFKDGLSLYSHVSRGWWSC
jgi:hypothetical protein